jgi:uncharacterized membrane protein (DUF2068 family)
MKSSTIDKIIAILAAIGGVLEIVVSFAYWGVKSLFIPGITVVPLSAVGEQGPYGPFYAVVLLVFGIGGLVFAVGAWGGHRWARDLGLILYAANFIAGVLYIALYPMFEGFTFLSTTGTAMSLFFLVFLLTRTGQKAFER